MKRHVPVAGHKNVYYSERVSGRTYEIRYRDSAGKLRFETCGPKLRDALDRQADVRVKLNRGERVSPNRMTLEECVSEWRLHRRGRKGEPLAPRTVDSYESNLRTHILPRLGSRRLQSLTPDDIALFLRELPLAAGTKRTVYAVLSDVLNHAANPRRGYIPFNPCQMLEDGERPSQQRTEVRVLDADETERLLAACLPWLRPIVQTSLLSGMRLGEVLGLRWQDVDFKQDVLHVRGQLDRKRTFVPTKGKQHRQVPLLPALRVILSTQPTRFQQGYVFTTQVSTPFIHSLVNRAFDKARTKAGLSEVPRKLRFHDMRHTFASALLRDGRDIAWVSELLGHASTQTTLQTYAHVIRRENRMEEAASRLGEALGSWAR